MSNQQSKPSKLSKHKPDLIQFDEYKESETYIDGVH